MIIKKSTEERVKAILEEATGQDLSSWEKNFLSSVRKYSELSIKQEAVLVKIEARLNLSPMIDLDDVDEAEENIKEKPKTDQFGFDEIDEYPF